MKVPPPTLAPILRSDTQGRLLARLFADPDRQFTLTELVDWAGSSMPTVLREVGRAEAAGIVVTEKLGPARLVGVNPEHPLYAALSQIVLATYGPPAVIAREFSALERANAVLIFGSWAARYLGFAGRPPNDIDVLIIGSPDRDAVEDAAERAERAIGTPVQATIRSRSQWDNGRDSFVREVQSRPVVIVFADDDIAAALPPLAARKESGE